MLATNEQAILRAAQDRSNLGYEPVYFNDYPPYRLIDFASMTGLDMRDTASAVDRLVEARILTVRYGPRELVTVGKPAPKEDYPTLWYGIANGPEAVQAFNEMKGIRHE